MKKLLTLLIVLSILLSFAACAESKPIASSGSVELDDDRSVSFELYKDGTAYAWTNFDTKAEESNVDTALVRFVRELMLEYYSSYNVGGYIGGKVYSFVIKDGEIAEEKASSNAVELSDEEYEEIIEEYSVECDDIRDCLDDLVNPKESTRKKHK